MKVLIVRTSNRYKYQVVPVPFTSALKVAENTYNFDITIGIAAGTIIWLFHFFFQSGLISISTRMWDEHNIHPTGITDQYSYDCVSLVGSTKLTYVPQHPQHKLCQITLFCLIAMAPAVQSVQKHHRRSHKEFQVHLHHQISQVFFQCKIQFEPWRRLWKSWTPSKCKIQVQHIFF